MIGETWKFTKTFSVEDTKKHCEFYEEYNKVHWDIDFVKKYTQYENVIVPGMMIQNFFVRIQKLFGRRHLINKRSQKGGAFLMMIP